MSDWVPNIIANMTENDRIGHQYDWIIGIWSQMWLLDINKLDSYMTELDLNMTGLQ